jgi:predicted nucleotidyltransferase
MTKQKFTEKSSRSRPRVRKSARGRASEQAFFRGVKLERVAHIIASLAEYDPQRVILFGSWARGDEDEYSDLDLVIIKETQERFLDRLERVYELVKPTFAMDVLVYTPQEFAKMQERDNPFIEMVLKEGVVIYERPKG